MHNYKFHYKRRVNSGWSGGLALLLVGLLLAACGDTASPSASVATTTIIVTSPATVTTVAATTRAATTNPVVITAPSVATTAATTNASAVTTTATATKPATTALVTTAAPTLVPTVVPAPPVKIAVGGSAPNFKVKTISGQELQLSALRGKAVVIDFWGVY